MKLVQLVCAATLLAVPLQAAPVRLPKMTSAELANYLPKDGTLEKRLDTDLNSDGLIDVVAVGRSDEERTITVLLGYVNETDLGYRPVGKGALDIDPLGTVELSVAKGVLLVRDLTGGTSAISSTYRYRYASGADRMQLIGDDVSFYSRTYAHGTRDISTNRLTGLRIETRSEVNTGGGQAALLPGKPKRSTVSRRPVYMEDAPLPAATIGLGG